MFQIEHISKSYGKKQVLNDVSFPVPEGCAIGILGVNGSGKSTLLSCIAKKYAGTPDVRIGYVPQENPLYDELKPVDNLRMWTNKRKSEILQALQAPPLAQLGIQTFLDTPVKNMSGGMKKRLSLACALLDAPQILLMDEPFGAVDEITRAQLQQEIKRIHEETKITIMFVTHDISEALLLGTKVLVMNKGNVEQYDTPEEILKNPATDFVAQLVYRQRHQCNLPDGQIRDCQYSFVAGLD